MSDFKNGFTAGDVRKAAKAKTAVFCKRCVEIEKLLDAAQSTLSHECEAVAKRDEDGEWYLAESPSEYMLFAKKYDAEVRAMDADKARMRQIADTIEGYRDETPLMLTADDYELIFGKDERTES